VVVLLKVSNLTVSYRGVGALHEVSIEVNEGELVSVIGANGAGKSTLLKAIMGWESAVGGAVQFEDSDITNKKTHLRAERGMRIVPERARIFPHMTVYENLLMGVYGLRRKIPIQERLDRLYSLFPVLEERSTQVASTLSGGEQQQLSIARACISAPKLLLVDEVSMGLMPRLADRVFELLKRMNKEEGLTILLVEQNALASLRISDRGYVLETGNIILEGEAERLLHDTRIREAYLGL
jgi:branched-chain amino acid transport system ATP-binding protein